MSLVIFPADLSRVAIGDHALDNQCLHEKAKSFGLFMFVASRTRKRLVLVSRHVYLVCSLHFSVSSKAIFIKCVHSFTG